MEKLLIAAGFVVSATRQTIPVSPATSIENPVEFGDVSIQRGAELYLAHCLLCHGPEGAGTDTPDPVHQHGSSANLTDERIVMQTDGDLYCRIDKGLGGTDMPAYEMALYDEEIWDLVNYVRWLKGERP